MSEANSTSAASLVQTNITVMNRAYHELFGHNSSMGSRLALVVLLVVLLQLTVKVIRIFSEWLLDKGHTQKSHLDFVTHQPKFTAFIQLLAGAVTFAMYFVAIGLVLQEFGVNLASYLVSASIIGFAVSFGSQGLVADVVISLTLIFSDAMDVGDMVEIAGAINVTVGRVQGIGLRFTKLLNSYNQIVFIPNRTIGNVSRFPYGGAYAYADVQIPAGVDRGNASQIIQCIATEMWVQFGAIILDEPIIDGPEPAKSGGWAFVRVHFKIWPGQGNLIETTFRQQMINAMKTLSPNYSDWQVPVTYRALAVNKNSKPIIVSVPCKPAS
jgi:moderate conductance mechanosensitive channel